MEDGGISHYLSIHAARDVRLSIYWSIDSVVFDKVRYKLLVRYREKY